MVNNASSGKNGSNPRPNRSDVPGGDARARPDSGGQSLPCRASRPATANRHLARSRPATLRWGLPSWKIAPNRWSRISTRTEADQDRLDATALFAAARAHEQRQDDAKALQLYERAVQAAPGTPAILRHIVVLAFNLDRRAEAARYAQLLESNDPDDAVLLRRLGLELADENDLQGALSLYRRSGKG